MKYLIKEGTCVIDIGGNIGGHTYLMCQFIGDKVHVYKVELV